MTSMSNRGPRVRRGVPGLHFPVSLLLAIGAVLGAGGLTACAEPDTSRPPATPAPHSSTAKAPVTVPELSDEEVAALPAATYDAVIPALLPYSDTTRTKATAYTLAKDSALYGADRSRAIARLPAKNFLGEPTTVVAMTTGDEWVLVLTPSRRELPSQRSGSASGPVAAQTSAWIRAEALQGGKPISTRVVIDTSAQTLTIFDASAAQRSFAVGVGADGTPTPANVTGYLQARYLDPAQGQTEYQIQLTSLHATAADEPYEGSVGGLIGIHHQKSARGAVSHGCIRLDAEAIQAVDALPLGTLVTILP